LSVQHIPPSRLNGTAPLVGNPVREFGDSLLELQVFIRPAVEVGYWAEVPPLPGCVSEGDTLKETLANIQEAADGWLEVSAEMDE
jgi:predicted RNase H-like HicB family nuclease